MRMNKTKSLLAFTLSAAMVLTSVNLPGLARKAKAAVTPPVENLEDTSVLKEKGDKLISTQTETSHVKDTGEYDGYIQTLSAEQLKSTYLKLTFTVAADTAAETKLFTVQPFDTKWGGWQDNIVKMSDAQYDETKEQYVAYVDCAKVLESYTSGGTINGANVSFCQSEPTVTLTGLYTCVVVDPDATLSPEQLKWQEEQQVVIWSDPETKTGYGHEQLQDLALSDIVAGLGNAGAKYAFDKVKSQNVTVYVKVTKDSRYSRLKISAGNLDTGSFSNKELIGIDNTTNTKENGGSGYKNNAHFLHAGWGTSGGYGSGMGQQESGIYKFENTNLKKGTADTAGLRLRRMTTDVEAYICGITFGRVGSVSVSKPDSDGKVTVTEGFDASKVESWNKDDSDTEPKPEPEMRADEVEAIQNVLTTVKAYEQKDILSEEVWTTLQDAIKKAEDLIADSTSLSTDIKAQRKLLENYLPTVEEEVDRTATRNGLKSSIDYCKNLKEEDYANKDTFAKLEEAIQTAQTAYDNVSDTRLNYKAARDTLEKVRVALAPNVSGTESDPKEFRILSKKEVVKEMGAGINLGNTMDGGLYDSSETGWQAYKTTKEYIKALHDAGYNTVRIPVTWGAHINEDYTIDEAWLSRVQEIVDYCVDQDMYAIINIHHDGAANHDNRGNNTPACWLDTYAQDIEPVYQKYEGVWKNIAERFKDYDEHLIFESMNEVTDAHGTATNEDDAVLNALNQLFINTVRSTGANNTKRWLAITGRFATTNAITEMPEDVLADAGEAGTTRLMFAVHIYKANNNVRWSYSDLKTWQSSMSASSKNVSALDPEMPLYVGEYGVRTKAQSGSATGYNNAERALNYELCAAVADFYGAVPVVWDQGTGNYLGVETEQGLFTDWNRPELKPVYDDVVFGTIRGTLESGKSSDLSTRMSTIYMSYGHGSTSDNGVSKDPEIAEATDITLSDSKVELKAGERKTITATSDSARDIVLWSTDNDSVATVYNGQIHAKSGGVTTVYAKSQSGSVVKEIPVIVQSTGDVKATSIKTEKAYYEITEGDTLTLNTTVTPQDNKDTITYTSSNTNIATVSNSGKVTAENAGLTYIVVKASSGISTIVAVKVNKKATSGTVSVTLNTIFSDSGLTEKSQPVLINGDGQYTLTYDLSKDLSADGEKADITKLENLTAVFIRDTNTLKPVVSQAKIRYDKVAVNDTELTLKKTDSMDAEGFKNLLKDNGQLDSNDPINGWDGSAVEEITVNSSKHSVSFKDIENPTKISVTFTIKDMKFFPGYEKENPTTQVESVTANKIVIPNTGESAQVEVKLTPATTDSEMTFYTTDGAIAVVDNNKQTVDADGNIKISVTAVSEGTTTLVGITENGKKVFYTIGVGDLKEENLAEPQDPTPEGLDGTEPAPSQEPSTEPTATASVAPSQEPSAEPTATASVAPSQEPGTEPTASVTPSQKPDIEPSAVPSQKPDIEPSAVPSQKPDVKPSATPSQKPDVEPSAVPSQKPNVVPTVVPTQRPNSSTAPSAQPATQQKLKKVVLNKVTRKAGNKISVKWKKDKTVTGYQIVYSSDKKFKKNVKKVTVNKNAATATFKVGKAYKKNCYVKIRAYVKVAGKKIYSAYSNVKKAGK